MRPALVLAAGGLLLSGAAELHAQSPGATDEERTRAEARYDSLATVFEELVVRYRESDGEGAVALLEAEEIAAIAEEILVEGDPGIANDLLAEAIALLESEPRE